MLTTRAFGKRTQDKRWLVTPPKNFGQVKDYLQQAETGDAIWIQVRDDAKHMEKAVRRTLGVYLDQLRARGFIRIVVKETLNTSANRMDFQYADVYADRPKPYNAKVARILLHPDRYGFLFEECDPDGNPVGGSDVPLPQHTQVAPPTPAGAGLEAIMAELQAMRAESAELREESKILRAELVALKGDAPPTPRNRKARKGQPPKPEA